MKHDIQVVFQEPKSKDPPYTLECEIVSGRAANEIIIKYHAKNERFDIPVLIDEDYKSAALLTRQEIKAITILESWRKPSTILKRTPYTTPAQAWLERHSGVPVEIELADGTRLRGNIEPRLKNECETIKQLENAHKVSKAVDRYQKILPDAERGRKVIKAASEGGRTTAEEYHKPTRKLYQAALVEYLRQNPRVSLTAARKRIAARFNVSRRTIERHPSNLSKK